MNTRANICKKWFLTSNHQNDNGSISMGTFFVWREWNQQLHQLKKGLHRQIEDFLDWYPFFSLSIELKAFCVTQIETPKMAKFAICTNKLSKKIAEHVGDIFGPWLGKEHYPRPTTLWNSRRKTVKGRKNGMTQMSPQSRNWLEIS